MKRMHLSSYERKLLRFVRFSNLLRQLHYLYKTKKMLMEVCQYLSERRLKDISCDNSTLGHKLTKSIETKLSKYEHDDTYIKSSLLDPRCKVAWFKEERVESLIEGF